MLKPTSWTVSSVCMPRLSPLWLLFTLIGAVWTAWYGLSGPDPIGHLLDRWEIVLTMAFGSFIAGATSEGGGAVAFPVLTKWLAVQPQDAKAFSLAIQSVGMTSASLMIAAWRVPVEWRAVFWASVGGLPGIMLGMALASLLPPPLVRMCFSAMVAGFALTLTIMNCRKGVARHTAMVRCGALEKSLLALTGLCGGILSGLVGNGIDIITFSVLVLMFRICEKVATPTSVVLMAVNALMGFSLQLGSGTFTPLAHDYWLAAIPVVVIGAPLGAFLCAHLNRAVVAWCLIALIAAEVATSLWIIPLDRETAAASAGVFLFFVLAYGLMYRSKRYQESRPET